MAMPLLTARGLHKTYRDGERLETVLAGVDLELFAGESVALLGRSGSGKSTLLNLLAGLDTVDSGEVRIAGQQMPVAERARSLLRRRHLGFVFQFFNLLGSLTVLENVALPLELNGTPAQRAADLALGKLDGVGLTALADAMPGRLSGGEQQRVAIARALVHEPDILLADEPTGNLDADSGRALLGLLSGMLVGNRAILVATHSLAVAQFADRVLTLEDGRVAERSGDFAW